MDTIIFFELVFTYDTITANYESALLYIIDLFKKYKH